MAHNQPLVSIGVPVYNSERCIRQALDALLAQTYENLELILCDNASTDTTGDICREYTARDPRIQYHRNPNNVGLYANFRRVVMLSSGEYFMWAAADDIRPPTMVEQYVQALLRNERAVMAHGIVLGQLEDREALHEYSNEILITALQAAERVRAFTSGLEHNGMLYGLYRREALVRGTLGSCLGQDYLLCLQMCLLGPLAYVKAPMIVLRERRATPSTGPMYEEVSVTGTALLKGSRVIRRKCWTVLLMGCYYLATLAGVPWTQRLSAVAAHVSTFSRRYRTRLAKEIVFQGFEPVVGLSIGVWRLAKRWPFTLCLARKIEAIFTRV